jgi:hypothetical protein
LNQFDPLQLIFYEEIVNELRSQLQKLRDVKVEIPRAATKIVDKNNVVVKDLWTFLELKGKGTVHEVLLVSNSSNFRTMINVDGTFFDWSYEELLELSPYIDTITAVQTNGQYIFRLNSVSFVNAFTLIISAKSVTFTKVYAKYDVFE